MTIRKFSKWQPLQRTFAHFHLVYNPIHTFLGVNIGSSFWVNIGSYFWVNICRMAPIETFWWHQSFEQHQVPKMPLYCNEYKIQRYTTYNIHSCLWIHFMLASYKCLRCDQALDQTCHDYEKPHPCSVGKRTAFSIDDPEHLSAQPSPRLHH